MEPWRQLAEEYMAYQNSGKGGKSFGVRLHAVRKILEHYLWKHRYIQPMAFLTLPPNAGLPPLFGAKGEAPFRNTPDGVTGLIFAHDFITWAMNRLFGSDEDGHTIVPKGVRVPFSRMEKRRTLAPSESVRAALPYRFILDLRAMLAPGEHFKDWQ